MPEPFWWLIGPLGLGYIIPIPLMLSIIIGWMVYGLQKSNLREDEARTRSTWIALICLVVFTLIGCWLFYAAHPGPIFL